MAERAAAELDEVDELDEDEVYGFWRRADRDPERIALIDPDGTEHSAGSLRRASNQLVHGLRELGLVEGDVVAVLLPNGHAYIEVLLATNQAGWYFVPINHHLKPAEIDYIIRDSGARALVVDERFASTASELDLEIPQERRFAVGEVPGFSSYGSFRDAQPDHEPDDRAAGMVMTYTSGTTGRPKGVKRPLPEYDPDLQGEVLKVAAQLFGLGEYEGTHLVTAPMYHAAPGGIAMAALHSGDRVVLSDDFDPHGVLRAIDEHAVRTTYMVPTMFARLLKLPEEVRNAYDLSSLTQVTHAGAPCPAPVKHAMIEWFGPVISEFYAASEGGGTLVTAEEWLERPGTVGKAWPVSHIRIADEEANELPPGEAGLIWIRMQLGMVEDFEYHGDSAKTRLTFDPDGYFTVGDIGYLDEDGYLFICDREIDMVISGGVNIYPAEVESALIEHPAIADVAVFGVPDDEWGEQVKAAVELLDDVAPSAELEEELIGWCRDRIAHLKCPRSIDFGPLPRDPNGKIFKRRLRDPYWEGRDRRV